MSGRETEVLISGGGLSGLALGIALSRFGHAVTVLEPRAKPAPDRWGFILWPPALRALEWVGVADAVTASGTRIERMAYFDDRARPWLWVDVGPMGALGAFVGVRPSAAETVLAQAAERAGVEVLRGAKLERLTWKKGGVKAELEQDGRPRSMEVRAVVGADGARSLVRERMGVTVLPINVPKQAVITGIGGPVPDAEMRQIFGRGWSIAVTRIGPAESWIALAVSGDHDARLLEIYEKHDRVLAGARPALRETARVEPFTGVARRWAADRALLIGDAAHPLLPHLGLGGTQALEDVPIAAEVLRDALRDDDLSAERLSAFRRARAERIAYAQRVSYIWALASAGGLAPLWWARDFYLAQLARRPDWVFEFVAALASTRVPSLAVRARVAMP